MSEQRRDETVLLGGLVITWSANPGATRPHHLSFDGTVWLDDEAAEALAAPFRKLPEGVERGYWIKAGSESGSAHAGWEWLDDAGAWHPLAGGIYGRDHLVRPVQSPDTERVPWWEALNRQVLVDGEARKVISVGMESDDAKPHFNTQSLIEGDFADKGYFPPYGADGTVEVIA